MRLKNFWLGILAVPLASAAINTVSAAIVYAAECPVPDWQNDSGSNPGNGIDAEAFTEYQTFYSPTVKENVAYRIWKPANYATSGINYRVVYLLHGGGGNLLSMSFFAKELENAQARGDAPANLITVSVNGLSSLYVNSHPNAPYTVPMESVIINELIPHIDATYRTAASREGRALVGFSMGGYGALHLGYKYPQIYSLIYNMAGAIPVPLPGPGMPCTFANDQAYFDQEHPTQLIQVRQGEVRGNTLIQMTVGSVDIASNTLGANTSHHDLLSSLSIAHNWEVVEGCTHSDNCLINSLLATPGKNPFKIFLDWTIPIQVNQAPVVNAGPDATIPVGQLQTVVGQSVTDDGLPNPPAAVTITWSKVSGPGSVAFQSPNAAQTAARFLKAGTYVIRCTATDGALTSSDTVTVIRN